MVRRSTVGLSASASSLGRWWRLLNVGSFYATGNTVNAFNHVFRARTQYSSTTLEVASGSALQCGLDTFPSPSRVDASVTAQTSWE